MPTTTVRVIDRSFVFSVGIYDVRDERTVAVELQDGPEVRAVVVNDSAGSVRWATELYERTRAESDVLG